MRLFDRCHFLVRSGHKVPLIFSIVLFLTPFFAFSLAQNALAKGPLFFRPFSLVEDIEPSSKLIPGHNQCIERNAIRPEYLSNAELLDSKCNTEEAVDKLVQIELNSDGEYQCVYTEKVASKPIISITKIRLKSVPGNEFIHINLIPTKNIPAFAIASDTLSDHYPQLIRESSSEYSIPRCQSALLSESVREMFSRPATPLEEIVLGRLVEQGILYGVTLNFNPHHSLIVQETTASGTEYVTEFYTKHCGSGFDSRPPNMIALSAYYNQNEYKISYNYFSESQMDGVGGGGEASGAGAYIVRLPHSAQLERVAESIANDAPFPSSLDEARRLFEGAGHCRMRR